MSASLVGSEMCIRDRYHTSVVGQLSRDPIAKDFADVRTCGVQIAACDAVSYTHLTLPTICSV
eukprot:3694652-Alexandrium_andersonii.AAC.1